MRPALGAIVLVVAAALIAGCARFPKTERLEQYDESGGYRYEQLDDSANKDDLFVILSFSGGGTRAAALAYGVLEALREQRVEMGNGNESDPRNLLQEVDVISSVSGGSFTAAAYVLNGGGIFEEGGRFQENFLYRDVEADLKRQLLNPYNWARLVSPTFGRIELATEVYKRLLFDEATFQTLVERGKKPFLMVNATDMTKGAQFTFIQPQFDPMCADLGSVSIARAVAASSNFPIAFTPLTLDSYPGSCGFEEPDWVEGGLLDLHVNPRRYYRARMLRTYREPERRYVHLLDGGVADNIGLRGPLTAIRTTDPALSVLRKINLEEIEKLVVITVDARNDTRPMWDESGRAPGLFDVIDAIASTPLANYSFDTLEMLQDTFRRRYDNQRRNPELYRVALYRIYVGFDQIADEQRRREFFDIGTTFSLPREEVDALRAVGGELLEGSPCFAELVAEAPRRTETDGPEGCF